VIPEETGLRNRIYSGYISRGAIFEATGIGRTGSKDEHGDHDAATLARDQLALDQFLRLRWPRWRFYPPGFGRSRPAPAAFDAPRALRVSHTTTLSVFSVYLSGVNLMGSS